ncbi:MAG: ComF family protein [Flavobacteriaceae bacterium]
MDNERCICTSCRLKLPLTNYHFDNNQSLNKLLYGRVPLVLGTSLFYFSKTGLVQNLIHNLKYKGFQSIGTELGLWLGTELSKLDAYRGIDVIIPVPLHKSKLRKRGYNQVFNFAFEIAKALDSPLIDDVLLSVKKSNSQVKKNRLRRVLEVTTKFKVFDFKKLENKHILLVDDVITTGTTVESCYNELKQIPNIKLSLATMAFVN